MFVTWGSNGRGSIMLWAPGRLTAAPAGTLVAAFDIDFLRSTSDTDSQNFIRNLIAYMAAPMPVTPAPPTLILALLGAGAAALYRLRRRKPRG